MLTSRLQIVSTSDPVPEDIFQSSLSALFTDDPQNSHGDPGGRLIYQSPLHGDIQLRVPVHPDAEAGRKLFAHYLWNAGVLMADLIERASHDDEDLGSNVGAPSSNRSFWDVRGQKVMEMGAGTALPSIISILSAASEVCISDHPSSPALIYGTIQANISENLEMAKLSHLGSQISIQAHQWGVITDHFPRDKSNYYSKLIVADCLWMPSQHLNLVRSIAHFLSQENPQACALLVAGFHTGRNVVVDFFAYFVAGNQRDNVATELKIAEIYEMDTQRTKRAWCEQRNNESKEEAKRWCVVAVIVRTRRTFPVEE